MMGLLPAVTTWLQRLRHPVRTASHVGARFRVARDVLMNRAHASYSQTGEDRLLAHLFEGSSAGFYVDIGAHHPVLHSNTAVLYQAGWTGIDVDASPGTYGLFRHHRPRSIALEVGVGTAEGTLPFYVFEEGGVSTFSSDWAVLQTHRNRRKMLRVVNVPVVTLAGLLERHLPPGQTIDVLSVDVEGLDLDVLGSNDWIRFRPRFVVVEDFSFLTIDAAATSPIGQFLVERGYRPIAATTASVVFKRDDVRWARLEYADEAELKGSQDR